MSISDAKRVSAALLLALLAAQAAAARQSRPPEGFGLRGPVKSVREYEARYVRAEGLLIPGRRWLSVVERYDVRGRRLSRYAYNERGELLYGGDSIYDASGRLKETRSPRGLYAERAGRAVYAYDSRGNRIEDAVFDEQNRLLGRNLYEYDARCHVTRHDSIAEGQNNLFKGHQREVYTLNADGRVVSVETFEVEGETLKPSDFGYGYQREVRLYDAAGLRDIRERLTGEGKLHSTVVTTFDRRGNLVEAEEYDADGRVTDRSADAYQFDARGSWVRGVHSDWVTRDGKSFFEPARVYYREIEYWGGAEARAALANTQPLAPRCAADGGKHN